MGSVRHLVNVNASQGGVVTDARFRPATGRQMRTGLVTAMESVLVRTYASATNLGVGTGVN